jgi:N-acetylmuramoyl-L-alanine amidase
VVFRLGRGLLLACLLLLVLGGIAPPLAVARERQKAQPPAGPLAGRVIVVDPGHGGIDPGAVSHSGVMEKKINLEIAQRLVALVKRSGGGAVLTRDGDYDLTERNQTGWSNRDELQARLELAERNKANLYISIHLNSYPSADCEGAQVFYHPGSTEGQRLAALVQQELIGALGDQYRWVKSEDFFVLRNSKCPAIVVEAGFLSHPREGALLSQPDYQDKVARCVCDGVIKFYAGQPEPRCPY